jgi:hypothetical protein
VVPAPEVLAVVPTLPKENPPIVDVVVVGEVVVVPVLPVGDVPNEPVCDVPNEPVGVVVVGVVVVVVVEVPKEVVPEVSTGKVSPPTTGFGLVIVPPMLVRFAQRLQLGGFIMLMLFIFIVKKIIFPQR